MAKIIHYLLDIGLYSKFLICCLEYGEKLPLKVLQSCDMIHKRELRFKSAISVGLVQTHKCGSTYRHKAM